MSILDQFNLTSSQNKYLSSIPIGREGWIYLIHAEGTNRYKIGRSINPITRQQQIQKQSPYPLKILRSFWSLDAVVDEALAHDAVKNYKVFGEWFDFGGTLVCETSKEEYSKLDSALVTLDFVSEYTVDKVASESIMSLKEVSDKYYRKFGGSPEVGGSACACLKALYYTAISRQEIECCDAFVRGQFRLLFTDICSLLETRATHNTDLGDIKIFNFVKGCVETFAALSFGRHLDTTRMCYDW